MKIVIIQDFLRCGGTEKQSVLLVEYLQASGHQAHLITFRPGGLIKTKLQSGTRHSLQKFDTRLDWFAPGIGKFIRSISPDGIVCFGTMANCYAGILQRKFPAIKVISTVRSGKSLSLFTADL